VTAVPLILVSDTHLSPAAPEAEANWDARLRADWGRIVGLISGGDLGVPRKGLLRS